MRMRIVDATRVLVDVDETMARTATPDVLDAFRLPSRGEELLLSDPDTGALVFYTIVQVQHHYGVDASGSMARRHVDVHVRMIDPGAHRYNPLAGAEG
jgi:hypothetical protein